MFVPRIVMLASAACLLVACANDPVPLEQLRITEQAFEQAQMMGADEYLEPAKKSLQQAKEAFAAEDFRAARLHAERAELDARLAEAQALTALNRHKLAEMTSQVQRLRQQLGGLQ